MGINKNSGANGMQGCRSFDLIGKTRIILTIFHHEAANTQAVARNVM